MPAKPAEGLPGKINRPTLGAGTNEARSALRARRETPRGAHDGVVVRRRCDSTCRKPSPSMAHCATCHLTFGGVSGFDQHRRLGECLDPQTLGMVERDGVWRNPMDLAARGRLDDAR